MNIRVIESEYLMDCFCCDIQFEKLAEITEAISYSPIPRERKRVLLCKDCSLKAYDILGEKN